jgi:hypothetical protein
MMCNIGNGTDEIETVRLERLDGFIPLLGTTAVHIGQREAEPDRDTSGVAVCRIHTPDLGVALDDVVLIDAYGVYP